MDLDLFRILDLHFSNAAATWLAPHAEPSTSSAATSSHAATYMHLLTHVSSHLDFHVHNSASQYVLLDNALSKSFTNRHAFGLEVPILAITTSSTINHHNISKQTEQQSIVATLCLHHHKQTNQTITTRLYTVRNHTTSSNTHATSHTPSDIIYLHSIIPSHDDRNRSQSQ